MFKKNISDVVALFRDEATDLTHRYYSFDFCYSHFRSSKESGKIDIEKSCYVLWSYLASWGMLRGSSFLLQKNSAYLKDLVEFIYTQPESIWQIDVEHYLDKKDEIQKLYKDVKELLVKGSHQDLTLVTKVPLGVFAIVPAYDRFFTDAFREIARSVGETCGFSSFSDKSLEIIHQFYVANKEEIDELSREKRVVDFDGETTKYHYSKAKIIDMYGFEVGFMG